MTKLEQTMKKIKFQSFGKIKIKYKSTLIKRNIELYEKKLNLSMNDDNENEINQIDDQISDILIEEQRKQFEHKLDLLNNIKQKKGRSAAIFKIK